MAASFAEAARALFGLNVLLFAIALSTSPLVFPPLPPHAQAWAVSTGCAAPAQHHETAARLRFLLGTAVFCAFVISSHLKDRAALPSAPAKAKTTTPRLLRALFLVSAAFSAASAALGMVALFYALETSSGLVACMPGLARATVYAALAGTGVALAGVLALLVREALVAE